MELSKLTENITGEADQNKNELSDTVQISRFIRFFGKTGKPPEWYFIIEAAQVLGCSVMDLDRRNDKNILVRQAMTYLQLKNFEARTEQNQLRSITESFKSDYITAYFDKNNLFPVDLETFAAVFREEVLSPSTEQVSNAYAAALRKNGLDGYAEQVEAAKE